MPLDVVQKMFTSRDAKIAELAKQPSITVADVRRLERTGRVRVADEMFDRCDPDARAELLNDEHHFVRSTASVSDRKLNGKPPELLQSQNGGK